jgi:3-oxoadipate enol-lactonase
MSLASRTPSAPETMNEGVHYRVFGSSHLPVLVFGNSLATDIRLWAEQIACLQGRYRIVVFDYPGHGSPLWPGVASMRQFAEKTASMLDALDIADYNYCGLSMGGALGMELALQHPQRMQKLVLSNTAAQLGPTDFWRNRMELARTQGMSALADATLARWFTAQAVEADLLRYAMAKEMFLATEPEGYAQCCIAIRDFDFVDRLSAIAVPTLVIAGTHDMACTTAQAHVIADAIPNAEYCELPTAHLGNLGASQEFNAALATFLQNE